MATITLGGNDYPSYVTEDQADEYLAADIARAATWALLAADAKSRALISATRFLARQNWASGSPPAADAAPLAIADATSMLAADMAVKPTLAASQGQDSGIKRVKAGSAEVEFKASTTTQALPLPADIWALVLSTGLISSGGDDAPVYSGGGFPSRFPDDCPAYGALPDWRL